MIAESKLVKSKNEVRRGVYVPINVFALQPMRIIGGNLRAYSAVCAPEGMKSLSWAMGLFRRIAICGIGENHQSDDCFIDALDQEGNIICSIDISVDAFNYARKQLKLKRIDNK